MNAKKFGTFSGVFSPSILTILGVIMFLRLPWLVGQGGLWMVLGVIVVAHVISTTTGLSVASIATDKKVRAGGSYYIISRSLGLPIGGTLGIALFVGMSFSISLYLIGFAESLLDYLPAFETTPANIRIAGSLALAAVAIVTLISTSLALRMQYIIMAAIVLAVGSVLLGGFGGETAAGRPVPAGPHLLPFAGAGFAVLFGIFFPAVTGFEAGVSMSGDLKDPRKSIPTGTLAAIAVGFLVYVGLAVFFAFRVDAKLLREDTGVLKSLSVFTPVLAAGIWGATISSALGSILGGPRILQAASQDRITPSIFAKGYGPGGEPRAALVLAVLIAEGGILIGELDVIARIVSMFFITAYFFLNLSAAFESWVSPDFKPDFRVPPYVGIIGATTCLIVMIQLDLLAMFGAFALLGLVWLHLKRKELVLETGDTWEGVWSSVVRRALFRLSRTRVHPRNWRPNMILFSGGEEARPHLIELARSLSDRRGVVSSFELIESGTARIRPRADQAVPGEEDEFDGVFSRRIECSDVYRAMDEIPRYYGFSGLEPNTVLLGRAHGLKNAPRFASLLQTYRKLDYNVILLDYNRTRRFGDYAALDIWWSGRGNMLDFALSAARFLKTSPRWNRARVRILVITDLAPRVELIHRHIAATLEQYRMSAEVRVIFNGVEQKPFFEIIARESRSADLTMLGMPPLDPDFAADDVARMNDLAGKVGSLLWMRASGFFHEIYTGSEPAQGTDAAEEVVLPIPHPEWPPLPELAGALENLYAKNKESLSRFHDELGAGYFDGKEDLCVALEQAAGAILDRLGREQRGEPYHFRRAVLAAHNDFEFQFHKAFDIFRARRDRTRAAGGLELSARNRFDDLSVMLDEVPEKISFPRPRAFFESELGDSPLLRLRKWRRRWNQSDEIRDTVPFRRVSRAVLTADMPAGIARLIRELNHYEYRFMVELLQSVAGFHASLRSLGETLADEAWEEARAVCAGLFPELRAALSSRRLALMAELKGDSTVAFVKLARDLTGRNVSRIARSSRPRRVAAGYQKTLTAENAGFENNVERYLEMARAGILLGSFRYRLRSIAGKKLDEFALEFHGSVVAPLEAHVESSDDSSKSRASSSPAHPGVSWRHPLPEWAGGNIEDGGVLNELIGEVQPVLSGLPATVNLLSTESLRQLEEGEFHPVEPVSIALRQYVEYSLETDFFEKARERLDRLDQLVRGATADALARMSLEAADESQGAAWRREIENLKNSGRLVLDELETDLERFLEDLGPFSLVRKSADMEGFIRSAEQALWRARLSALGGVVRELVQKFFAALVFGRSQALVLARFFDSGASREPGRLHRLISAIAERSPDPERLARIPLYYLHLFTGNLAVNPDFWVGREREMALAEKAFSFFRRGSSGALFVTGPSGSGKSWLASHAARRHMDTVFEIFPPAEGAAGTEQFHALFSKTLSQPGKPGDVLFSLPPAAIVIHDLELFWERRPGGLAVIDEILSLVEAHGHRHFFVLNTSSRAYALFQRLRGMDDFALGRVICGPFSADLLKKLILLRHGFAGYEFELDGIPEREASGYALARYFHRLFRASGGLPGPALRTWIQSAELVGERRIALRAPETARADLMDLISFDWILLLEQFFLHKNFTRSRLDAVFGAHAAFARRLLPNAVRGGLVVENDQGIYKINPWVRHLVAEEFGRRISR